MGAVTQAIKASAASWTEGSLRICALLPTINSYGGVISTVNMLDEFLEMGHSVTLVTLSKYAKQEFILRYEPIYLANRSEATTLLKSQPFDFVIATSWETVEPALEISADTGAFPVYFVQDIESDFLKGIDDARFTMAVESYGKIRTKIVKTEFLRRRLIEMGHDATVILPGMNLNIFYPRRPADKKGPLNILAMARPNAPNGQRGFDVIVDTFRSLSAYSEDFAFGLFGDAHLSETDIGVPYQNFGRLSSAKLASAYSWADVYIDASRFHGFGRTGVEAMACGAVAVLSDSGGIRHYAVDGENALIVPVGDVDATVNAVLKLKRNPELRAKLVEAGLKTVSYYDDCVAAQQFLAVSLRSLEESI